MLYTSFLKGKEKKTERNGICVSDERQVTHVFAVAKDKKKERKMRINTRNKNWKKNQQKQQLERLFLKHCNNQQTERKKGSTTERKLERGRAREANEGKTCVVVNYSLSICVCLCVSVCVFIFHAIINLLKHTLRCINCT